MKTKVMPDGFLWLVIDRDLALYLFRHDEEVYRLYDDGSEGLCESEDDITADYEYGHGLGFVQTMYLGLKFQSSFR